MKLKIILPFPLPTWNRLFAMDQWQRKSVRDLIHQFVSMCTQYAPDSQTLTVSPQKRQLMESYMPGYLQMIRPNKSSKSVIRRLRHQVKEETIITITDEI